MRHSHRAPQRAKNQSLKTRSPLTSIHARATANDGRDGRVRGGGVSVSLRQKREVCRSLLKQSQPRPPTARSSAVSPESDIFEMQPIYIIYKIASK